MKRKTQLSLGRLIKMKKQKRQVKSFSEEDLADFEKKTVSKKQMNSIALKFLKCVWKIRLLSPTVTFENRETLYDTLLSSLEKF